MPLTKTEREGVEACFEIVGAGVEEVNGWYRVDGEAHGMMKFKHIERPLWIRATKTKANWVLVARDGQAANLTIYKAKLSQRQETPPQSAWVCGQDWSAAFAEKDGTNAMKLYETARLRTRDPPPTLARAGPDRVPPPLPPPVVEAYEPLADVQRDGSEPAFLFTGAGAVEVNGSYHVDGEANGKLKFKHVHRALWVRANTSASSWVVVAKDGQVSCSNVRMAFGRRRASWELHPAPIPENMLMRMTAAIPCPDCMLVLKCMCPCPCPCVSLRSLCFSRLLSASLADEQSDDLSDCVGS